MNDMQEKCGGFGIGEAGRGSEGGLVDPSINQRVSGNLVKCACGHTVPESQVMWANLGTSCPDCYDRMSN